MSKKKVWKDKDIVEVVRMAKQGATLREMCNRLERTMAGVFNRLEIQGYLTPELRLEFKKYNEGR